jgi:hypothetical protein
MRRRAARVLRALANRLEPAPERAPATTDTDRQIAVRYLTWHRDETNRGTDFGRSLRAAIGVEPGAILDDETLAMFTMRAMRGLGELLDDAYIHIFGDDVDDAIREYALDLALDPERTNLDDEP